MPSKEELEVQYRLIRPSYLNFANKMADLIKDIITSQNINFHAVTFRAKKIDSFVEKAMNPKYTDAIKQITDKAGVRIIAYVEDDVQKISELINNEFSIDEKNSFDKSLDLGEDKVGYRSIHKICKLNESRTSLVEYSVFSEFEFELQIRTILQHSWAEIEHDKNYKFSGVLPPEIKRRFKLVAGALEILDREFNQLSLDIDAYSAKVVVDTKSGQLDISINSTSLYSYLCTKFQDLIVGSKIYPDLVSPVLEENIIGELKDFGVATLRELDDSITPDFMMNLSNVPILNNNFIGLLRIIMISKDYKRYFKYSFTKDWQGFAPGWDEFFVKMGLNSTKIEEELMDSINGKYDDK